MYASHKSKFVEGEIGCPTIPLHRINLNPPIFIKGLHFSSFQEHLYFIKSACFIASFQSYFIFSSSSLKKWLVATYLPHQNTHGNNISTHFSHQWLFEFLTGFTPQGTTRFSLSPSLIKFILLFLWEIKPIKIHVGMRKIYQIC